MFGCLLVGIELKSIGPSMAAEVMGWRSLPQVGVPVIKVANEVGSVV